MQRAAQRANTSGYADPSAGGEISGLVDNRLAQLYNTLVAELYEDFALKRTHFPLVADQRFYPLPTDFMKERRVWLVTPSTPFNIETGARWALNRLDPADAYGYNALQYSNLLGGYSLEGSTLVCSPTPTSSNSGQYIQLLYIPQYSSPANDNDTINFPLAVGWDEWVVNGVVIDIRAKAMMPFDDIAVLNQQYEGHVRLQAKNRSATSPPRVRRTGWGRGGGGSPWGDFSVR
jgi:hypothetical protein